MNIDERFLDDQPFDTAQAKDYISGYLGRINSGAENKLCALSDQLETGTQVANDVSAEALLALTGATEKSLELTEKVAGLTDVQSRYIEQTIMNVGNFHFDRWGSPMNEANGDPVGAYGRAEEAFEHALSTPEDALIAEMNSDYAARSGLTRVKDDVLSPEAVGLATRITQAYDPLNMVVRGKTVAALLPQPNPTF